MKRYLLAAVVILMLVGAALAGRSRSLPKVSDSLEAMLSNGDPLPVMVVFHAGAVMSQALAQVNVTHRYETLPMVAALATPDQIRALARLPEVAAIEWDRPVHAALDGANTWAGTAQARVDFGLTGAGVGIAILDTGIDAAHVDLNGSKVVAWHDVIDSETTTPYDDNGHGTHVASIAAGRGAANGAFAGVAPGASLIGIKVLAANGDGTLSTVAAGIDWAIANREAYGIRIISLSLEAPGSSDGSDSLSRAVDRAVEAGLIAVVAAGNSGPGQRTTGAPAAAARAITVGALTDPAEGGYSPAAFSSRGPTADGRVKPDVMAPGVNIGAAASGTGNRYVEASGTSMAAPFVSGVVALMLEANPALTPAQVLDMLGRTAADWGPPGPDNEYGRGVLDGFGAIRMAGGYQGAPPWGPDHFGFQGEAVAGRTAVFTVPVGSTRVPLAATLIAPSWLSPSSPDFSLSVYGPDGTLLGSTPAGSARQKVFSNVPLQTGSYRLEVSGSGAFYLDASARAPRPQEPPPQLTVLGPAADGAAAGVVQLRVGVSGSEAVAYRLGDSPLWAPMAPQADGTFAVALDTRTMPDGPVEAWFRATGANWQESIVKHRFRVWNAGERVQARELTGTLTASVPVQWREVAVDAPGWLDLSLAWPGGADLDLEVYTQDGRRVGSTFGGDRPEQFQADTAAWGTGVYRVKVALASGAPTAFTLTARGAAVRREEGRVTPGAPAFATLRPNRFPGIRRVVLSWEGGADLDFTATAPGGGLVARGFTTGRPEEAWFELPGGSGDWRVEVRLAAGDGALFALETYNPEAILR